MNMKSIGRCTIVALILTVSLIPAGGVFGQTPEPPSDDEVNDVARELFCPICENIPLDVCPTEACRDWRELIRQMLAEGKSKEQIMDYFVDNYGARVVGIPPAEGINWLAYLIPPVAFVIGVVLLFQAFRIWKQLPAAQAAEITLGKPGGNQESLRSVSDDQYAARLEQELKKRR
jgi:cytochrome c-type biogenesis protein CcmH